jgi:hypothetical protein
MPHEGHRDGLVLGPTAQAFPNLIFFVLYTSSRLHIFHQAAARMIWLMTLPT